MSVDKVTDAREYVQFARQCHDAARCGYGTLAYAAHGNGRAFDACTDVVCVSARRGLYQAQIQAVVEAPLNVSVPHTPTAAEWADLGRPEDVPRG